MRNPDLVYRNIFKIRDFHPSSVRLPRILSVLIVSLHKLNRPILALDPHSNGLSAITIMEGSCTTEKEGLRGRMG